MFRLLFVAALTTSAFAADLSARWIGTIESNGTNVPVSLCLTVEPEENIAGSIAIEGMRFAARIENVIRSADSISFTMHDDRNRELGFTLKHSRDDISGEALMGGIASRVVLTRAEEPFLRGWTRIAPALIHKIEPQYTEEAQAAKLKGDVRLSVEIDQNGIAQNIKVQRGLGMGLDEKAIECVRQWKFKPGTMNGEPVMVPATIEVNFRPLNF